MDEIIDQSVGSGFQPLHTSTTVELAIMAEHTERPKSYVEAVQGQARTAGHYVGVGVLGVAVTCVYAFGMGWKGALYENVHLATWRRHAAACVHDKHVAACVHEASRMSRSGAWSVPYMHLIVRYARSSGTSGPYLRFLQAEHNVGEKMDGKVGHMLVALSLAFAVAFSGLVALRLYKGSNPWLVGGWFPAACYMTTFSISWYFSVSSLYRFAGTAHGLFMFNTWVFFACISGCCHTVTAWAVLIFSTWKPDPDLTLKRRMCLTVMRPLSMGTIGIPLVVTIMASYLALPMCLHRIGSPIWKLTIGILCPVALGTALRKVGSFIIPLMMNWDAEELVACNFFVALFTQFITKDVLYAGSTVHFVVAAGIGQPLAELAQHWFGWYLKEFWEYGTTYHNISSRLSWEEKHLAEHPSLLSFALQDECKHIAEYPAHVACATLLMVSDKLSLQHKIFAISVAVLAEIFCDLAASAISRCQGRPELVAVFAQSIHTFGSSGAHAYTMHFLQCICMTTLVLGVRSFQWVM